MFKRSLNRQAHILRLHVRQFAEFRVHVSQMQQCDLLIQDLGQHIDAYLFLPTLAKLNVSFPERFVFGFEEHNLCQDLVGEGAGHDEGGVTGCAAKVYQAAFGEKDDVATGRHEEAVDLWFDGL